MIELAIGDITEQEVDAIVNAANPSLLGGVTAQSTVRVGRRSWSSAVVRDEATLATYRTARV